MRTCIIFNPTAKGQKAEKLRSRLDEISKHAVLKSTTAAGDARRLTTEAIQAGCDTIIAAGGDGTVNEVLNGIGDAQAFNRVRLGILPLGTVNVFARELGIPTHPSKAWDLVLRGRYTRIDLAWVEFNHNAHQQRRYFAQLAGAGLDARAIKLVEWKHKQSVGPLAYVIAGFKALRERQPKITVTCSDRSTTGEFVLIGNGNLYGGSIKMFPEARLRDGQLDICIFPRMNAFSAIFHLLQASLSKNVSHDGLQRLRAAEFTIAAEAEVGFELDGEWIGNLPANFGVEREQLRVIVP